MLTPDAAFEAALSFALRAEGGFVDDPLDHGGATNRGVTQAVFSEWLKEHDQPDASVRQISDAEVRAIYRDGYWAGPHIDRLAEVLPVLAIAVFDFAVNSGAGHAIKILQGIANVADDGILGPATIGALEKQAAVQTEHILVVRYNAARAAFDRRVASHGVGQQRFLAGWLNRVRALDEYLKTLV